MPLKLYQEASGGDFFGGLRNLVDWLTGSSRGSLVGGATTGPTGVQVVEADDGTLREVSGDGTLAGLGAGNKWRTGTGLAAGNWIVVSFPGTGANGFQVLLYCQTSQRIAYQLIPLADWATGGGSTSTPTLPATTVPAARTNGSNYPVFDHDANVTFRAFCDEGVLCFTVDDGVIAEMAHYYAGEVDEADAADTRPFVILDNVDEPLDNLGDWQRLSPVDGTTILTLGDAWGMNPYNNSNQWNNSDPQYTDFHNRVRGPIGVGFRDVAHQHIAGWCRYMEAINQSVAQRATADSLARIIFNHFTSGQAAIICSWDGATAYP